MNSKSKKSKLKNKFLKNYKIKKKNMRFKSLQSNFSRKLDRRVMSKIYSILIKKNLRVCTTMVSNIMNINWVIKNPAYNKKVGLQ